jgi:hypothetical protein
MPSRKHLLQAPRADRARIKEADRTRLGRKYRYMDANLQQRKRGLEEKIPDIKKTLSMVEFLQERRVSPVFSEITASRAER